MKNSRVIEPWFRYSGQPPLRPVGVPGKLNIIRPDARGAAPVMESTRLLQMTGGASIVRVGPGPPPSLQPGPICENAAELWETTIVKLPPSGGVLVPLTAISAVAPP